jgi:hypothetical protein
MNADSNFGKIAEIEQSQSIAEPVVSERLKEQKEVLRQKELEEEKKIEYKKKLYEDRKEVVAEYESQRQKNK